MSPKKPQAKKPMKSRTAMLEAVPAKKTGKNQEPAPGIRSAPNKLALAPRSSEFAAASRSGEAGTATAIREEGVEGRYVYGIIQASQPKTFGKTGIGASGENVYTIH